MATLKGGFVKDSGSQEPKKNDDPLQAAGDAVEGPDQGSREAAPETGSPLFEDAEGEAPESGATQDPEASSALFDEVADAATKADGETPVSPKAFKRRIGKLIEQREAAKTEAGQTKERLAQLETELKSLRSFSGTFETRYGSFKDPAKQLAWDTEFMAAAEKLSKTNFQVARALDEIKSAMGGKTNMSDESAKATEAAAKAAEATTKPAGPDPAVQKLLERDARREARETLTALNVKPGFVKIITDAMLAAPGADLAEISPDSITDFAKDYIATNGFEPGDVLVGAKSSGDDSDDDSAGGNKKTKVKPKTSGGSDKAAVKRGDAKTDAADAAAKDKKPEPPKSPDEWRQARNARIDALFKEQQSA